MHNIQRLVIKQREAANALKEKIIKGDINSKDNQAGRHQSATIRRLMNKENTQKPSQESIIAIKKEIELAKYRVMLLNQEKTRKVGIIRYKSQTCKKIYDENSKKSKLNFNIFYYKCQLLICYEICAL